MIALEKFTEKDFARFKSWIKSEQELIQFAGPQFIYPVTDNQLTDYLKQFKKQPFKICLTDTNEVIGHCELNFENELPRLSRILIGIDNQRNKGIGKLIVKKMVDIVFTTTGFTSIDLSVFDWNLSAIACYKKMGFEIRPGLSTTMIVAGTEWKAVNMILHKDAYYAV